MSAATAPAPLSAEHFHAVDAQTLRQTIQESDLQYSMDMGSFTVHHGKRYGKPIVIVEHHNQQADQLSGIWFDDGCQ